MATWTDTFDRSDRILNGDNGWVRLTPQGSGNSLEPRITSNKVGMMRGTLGPVAYTMRQTNPVTEHTDFDVSCTTSVNNTYFSLYCRFDAASNCYRAYAHTHGTTARTQYIQRFDAGVATTLGSATFATGTSCTHRFTGVGSQLTYYTNGVKRIQVSDGTYTTGLLGFYLGASGYDFWVYVDTFTATYTPFVPAPASAALTTLGLGSWSDVSAEDGYHVEWSVDGGAFGDQRSIAADVLTCAYGSLSGVTTLQMRVRAHRAGATSAWTYSPTVEVEVEETPGLPVSGEVSMLCGALVPGTMEG